MVQKIGMYLETFPLWRHLLQNGMELLLLPQEESRVVSCLLHYRVGSAAEQEHERGLAHFFEHMMFRETKHLADGEYDRIIAECGGVGLNAFTSYDTTAYHVRVPQAELQRVLQLEAERMAWLRLSKEKIEAERGAILGELRMYHDMPSEQLWNRVMAEAFSTHPYHHPVIGYEEQIQRFSVEDLQAFYARHYAPAQAVLVLAGKIDPPQAMEWVEECFGELPCGPAPETLPAPEPPWKRSKTRTLKHARVSTDTLVWSWQSPGLQHSDFTALVLGCALLSMGRSAPLYRALVHSGLATQASLSPLDLELMMRSPALIVLEVTLCHGVQSEQAAEALEQLLRHTCAAPPAAEELERTRNQLRLASWEGTQSAMNLARQVGGFVMACDDPTYGESLLRAVERTPAQVIPEVLQRYLLQAPRLEVVQRPTDCGPS